jgi:hypothetical protein
MTDEPSKPLRPSSPAAALRRAAALAVALAVVGAAPGPISVARAQAASDAAPQRELLNSERIERRFGSYAVEVLTSDSATRVTNLYSTHRGARICRTFAVSRYPAVVDPAFAAEHAEIVAGGSIGAVFAAHGWTVRKTHLYYGELQAWPKLAALMHIAPATTIAEDIYVLEIVKGEARFEYATIAEIHHPDYLRSADFPALYGRADARGREDLVRTMQAFAAVQAAR